MNLEDITKPSLLKEREISDLDLVTLVKGIMDSQNYSLANEWLNEAEIVEATGKNTDLQRFLINRNLRVRLGKAPVPTNIERFVLDSQTGVKEYLDNMAKYVVPALVKISQMN